MSSPVFDEGTGRLFLQKCLNSLLFGISFEDERNFSVKSHVLASVTNIIFAAVYILSAFLDNIIASAAISSAIPLLYIIFSYCVKDRESEKLFSNISLKDEWFNALMNCYCSHVAKAINLVLNILSFFEFSCSVYYFRVSKYSSVAVAISIIHALRSLDSGLNKSEPVNEFEPSLSLFVYNGIFLLISWKAKIVATVLFSIYPVMTFIGIFPQIFTLFEFLCEKICVLSGNVLVEPQSFAVAISIIVTLIFNAQCLFIISILLAVIGLVKQIRIRIVIYFAVSVAVIIFSVLNKYYDFLVFGGKYLSFIDKIDNKNYIVLGVTCALSALSLGLLFLQKENQRPAREIFNISFNISLSVLGVLLTVFFCFEYFYQLLNENRNLVAGFLIEFSAVSIGMPLNFPLQSLVGTCLGSWLNFVFGVPYFTCQIVGVWIFNSCNRLIELFEFMRFECQYCFKSPIKGWQLKLYNIRSLVYVYNGIVFIICAFLDLPALPIGGIPVFVIFHPHPLSFFTQKSTYELVGRKLQIPDADENKSEKEIYSHVVDSLLTKQSMFSRELRKINFCSTFLPAGTIELLMCEKKMLFLINTGTTMFRLHNNYLVYALETVETSCHTLERTCLERYVEYLKFSQNSNSIVVYSENSQILTQSNRNDAPMARKPQQEDNRLPRIVPEFSSDWLVKFISTIKIEDLDQTEYSIAGVFTSQENRQQLSRMFVSLLSQEVCNFSEDQQGLLVRYYQSLKDRFLSQCSESRQVLQQLQVDPKTADSVLGVCIYLNFAYNSIGSDEVIPELYAKIKYVMKNEFSIDFQKQLQKSILLSFRLACYHGLNVIMMGDDFPATSQDFEQLRRRYVNYLFSVPTERQWGNEAYEKKFAIVEGPRAIEISNKQQEWALFNVKNHYYRSIWSSVQTDLLSFNATDDERFSVQSLPAALRNLFCEAAGAPFGYPLVEFGQGVV